MRILILGSVIASVLGSPRAGYNAATQSFVIRQLGLVGEEVHHIMFGQVDNCQEFFLVKDFVNDEDRFVEFASKTDIVSCTEPSGSAEIVDAYGIKAEYVCSPGTSNRSIAVSCSAGSSQFGGFVIFLGDEQGCLLENAVGRCGGAFLKFREFTKSIQDALQADITRSLDEIDSSVDTDGSVPVDDVDLSFNTNESAPVEDITADPISVNTVTSDESNPTEIEIPDVEPQEFEIAETTQSETEDIEPL